MSTAISNRAYTIAGMIEPKFYEVLKQLPELKGEPRERVQNFVESFLELLEENKEEDVEVVMDEWVDSQVNIYNGELIENAQFFHEWNEEAYEDYGPAKTLLDAYKLGQGSFYESFAREVLECEKKTGELPF